MGSRSCQVSNGIKGRIATDYAGLGLVCTGVPDIPFPFFTQSAEEPEILTNRPMISSLLHRPETACTMCEPSPCRMSSAL